MSNSRTKILKSKNYNQVHGTLATTTSTGWAEGTPTSSPIIHHSRAKLVVVHNQEVIMLRLRRTNKPVQHSSLKEINVDRKDHTCKHTNDHKRQLNPKGSIGDQHWLHSSVRARCTTGPGTGREGHYSDSGTPPPPRRPSKTPKIPPRSINNCRNKDIHIKDGSGQGMILSIVATVAMVEVPKNSASLTRGNNISGGRSKDGGSISNVKRCSHTSLLLVSVISKHVWWFMMTKSDGD